MLVKNVIGSSRFQAPRGYSSWLEYWEAMTGKKARYCGAMNCYNTVNLVGAHVQKAYSTDQHWYITPLCNSCNGRTDVFDVTTELVPVPSNL